MRLFRQSRAAPPPPAGQTLGEAIDEIETRLPATEKQRAFIASLAEQTGAGSSDGTLEHASIRDASLIIEKLITQVPPTDKQREYVASLASEFGLEVRLPADATWGSVSRVLDELVNRHPASDAQTSYLENLCVELGISPAQGEIAGLGKSTASRYIEALVIERGMGRH
jgi:hypothetical protein